MELQSTESATTSNAVCAHHPERSAALTCERCGDFVCAECVSPTVVRRCARCAEVTAAARYYYTPPWRFVLQSVLTFGLYDIFWFERNWRAIRAADQSRIWPLARAIFARFTYYQFVNDLNTYSTLSGRTLAPLSGGLGLAYFFASAFGKLPDPWGFLGLLAGLCVVPSVTRVGELISPAEVEARSKLHPRHFVLYAVGAVLWMFLIAGIFLPADPGAAGLTAM